MTDTGPTTSEITTPPPDIVTMRASIDRLLDPDATPDVLPPADDEVATLAATLRGHLQLLLPEVEDAARQLPRESIPRYCVLACVGEARVKLRTQPGPGQYGALVHARKLARALVALCDHYETLTGDAPPCS